MIPRPATARGFFMSKSPAPIDKPPHPCYNKTTEIFPRKEDIS